MNPRRSTRERKANDMIPTHDTLTALVAKMRKEAHNFDDEGYHATLNWADELEAAALAVAPQPDLAAIILKYRVSSRLETQQLLDEVEGAVAPQPETWWIGLNGHGQIIGAYRTQEQAQANTNYVIGIQPKEKNVDTRQITPVNPESDRISASAAETAPSAVNAISAIRSFLDWGEDAYKKGHQGGYFSGSGWAAVKLREHLAALESAGSPPRGFTPVDEGKAIGSAYPLPSLTVTVAPQPPHDDTAGE
jgi:hypothetical protein